ncbi:MAG TPA: prolyl oligopeptidase family serine peptidase [Candidatus Acidoferrum sp.]|nr:prolyl oligopeptidase family serine peptidase [Candidatus Acidoferrum sp.]
MTAQRLWTRLSRLLIPSTLCVLGALPASGQDNSGQGKRSITVSDAIEMTRVGEPDLFSESESKERVARFSPDGRQFVLVLKKGNVERNINEYSLLLFQTGEAFHSPKPIVLLTMSSSSNRDALHGVKWLNDNETLAFVGEKSGEPSQVYTFNIRTEVLTRRTNHPTAINHYDITSDGQEIVFAADPQPSTIAGKVKGHEDVIVVADQGLSDLLAGDCPKPSWQNKLFLQKSNESPTFIPVDDAIYHSNPVSISPGGRYALIAVYVRDVPTEWGAYKDEDIQRGLFSGSRRKGQLTGWKRYLLLDTKTEALTPLLNTPMPAPRPFVWGPDGHSVFMKSYLPLNVVDPAEKEVRSRNELPAEVTLTNRQVRRITPEEWEKARAVKANTQIDVTLVQDVNQPPRVFVSGPRTQQKTLLFDPNPQFAALEFGEVEAVQWKATDGVRWNGVLFLPPAYAPGKRYPLVIQTHGVDGPGEFSMDGRSEWSSAFAARPLAARGFIVLGVGMPQTQDYAMLKRDGLSPRGSLHHMSKIEGAIDYLDQRGMIDRNRVGINGFSITVLDVSYTLTHSKYSFAAANLVDGIDGGYLQYLLFPGSDADFDQYNGGPPFGEGLKLWLANSSGFNLDKVHTPVRLLALQDREGLLEMWQWFAGLRNLGKPVDFTWVPDADHFVVTPRQKMVAQQGLVDWFCYWLKNEEDPDTSKRKQYERWEELRKPKM